MTATDPSPLWLIITILAVLAAAIAAGITWMVVDSRKGAPPDDDRTYKP